MSEVGLQISSNLMDPYLRQLVPVLQTSKEAVREITQRELKVRGEERGTLFIIFRVEIRPVGQQNQSVRSRNPSSSDIKTDVEALQLIEHFKLFADKLRDVALKVLTAEAEMQRGGSTLSRKIKKLTELKKSLDEFTRLLDKIVAFYSARFLGFHPAVDLPPLEDVKKLKEQLSSLKSQLKKDELSSLFASYDAEFNTSNEVIMCTILGLSDDYGAWLEELDTSMLMHNSVMYYLQRSIENREEELEAEGTLCQSGKEFLAENLQKLGFNKETANIITQNIPDEFVDLQKPSFWAVRYLDHACQHHPLLGNGRSMYLQNEHPLDEWFEMKLPLNSDGIRDTEDAKLDSDETRDSEDAKLCAVKMINISSDESQGNVLVGRFLKELDEEGENCLLFHGTTHKSAMSVVADGIIVPRGSKQQDFSNGDGFYLSEKFENAKAWSRAGRGGNQAVVVYKVNRSLLNSNESHGLDLSQNTSLWEGVVRYCRSGYTNKKHRKVLGKYAFIQGPPCKNPGDINEDNPLQRYEEAGIQLCIRDDAFAEEFGSLNNVACVIFFNLS